MRMNLEEVEEFCTDESVREAFMRRDDIADLSDDERERRWQDHVEKLRPFMEFLAGVNVYEVSR